MPGASGMDFYGHDRYNSHVKYATPLSGTKAPGVGNVSASGDTSFEHPRDLGGGKLTGGTPAETPKVRDQSTPDYVSYGSRIATPNATGG